MVADKKLACSGLGAFLGGAKRSPHGQNELLLTYNCGKRRFIFGKQIEPVGQRASHQERKGVMKREES